MFIKYQTTVQLCACATPSDVLGCPVYPIMLFLQSDKLTCMDRVLIMHYTADFCMHHYAGFMQIRSLLLFKLG